MRHDPLSKPSYIHAAILAVWMTPLYALGQQAVPASSLPAPQVLPKLATNAVLQLATSINGKDMGLLPAQWRNGELWMQRATLLSVGVTESALHRLLALPGQNDWLALSGLPDIKVDYRASTQQAVLAIPFGLLNWPTTSLSPNSVASPIASATPGLMLNYDLYGASNNRGARGMGAMTELRAFRANSVFSNTMLSQYSWGNDTAATSTQPHNVRLDTTYSQSSPDRMLSFRAGDTLTSAVPWSRSTRIAGVQLARNFALQPYRVTTPIPALMGTSALPSEIELYINGSRQYQGSIPSGPFSINTPTGISGTGNAQVVLTDAFGRTTTIQYSLYGTSSLLSQGLSDWSAELGWVRKNYGLKSFDYGSDLVGSASWRYGLTNAVTLQSHAEAKADLVNAGAGVVWQIGQAGVVSGALAASQNEGHTGHQVQLGYNWNNQSFYTSWQGTRASDNYRDIAALYDGSWQKSSGRALVGYNSTSLGSFSVGALYLHQAGQAAQRYVTAGWSRAFGGKGFVSLNANHNLDDRRASNIQISLNWMLGDKVSTGMTIDRQDGRTTANAYASESTPSEGGWGWSAAARSGTNGGAQARAEYLASAARINASVARYDDATTATAGVTGALILMGGHMLPSRRIDDSFAVVSTNGVPHVPIKRENVVIGQTNADGVMLVPQLAAYHSNKISIDPLTISAQTKIPAPDQWIAPTDRAGVMVQFELQAIRSASIKLVDTSGAAIPLGSFVTLSPTTAAKEVSTSTALVGFDGMTYFENMANHNRLSVLLPDGDRCEALADWPASAVSGIPVIGPLTCKSH